ncbi:hypothetical protein ZWY2020_019617 [Hordeum vulgare]|nr:hypothetical protein ZWY2020_019617 [Hordeum vulgare]
MAPAAGRGRGRGRARGRGRGRGRGRAAKTPPPAQEAAAPEEAPDAAEQQQEQEQELTETHDASAGRETIEISDSSDASSPQPHHNQLQGIDHKIKDEPGSAMLGPSEADVPSATSDDGLVQQQEMDTAADKEALPPQEAQGHNNQEDAVPDANEQAVQNEAQGNNQEEVTADTDKQAVQIQETEVNQHQGGGKADDDDDVAVKTAAAATQSATDDAQNKQDSQAETLGQGEMVAATDNSAEDKQDQLQQGQMDAEQEEEDPQEVIFEDSASVGEGQAATELKQGEDRARATEEDDGQAAAKSKNEEHRARAAEKHGQAAGEVKENEDERKVMSDMAKNRQRKKELEIFVGGLDREAVEEDIRKVFSQVGDVVEVRLHKDFSTSKNKGFAFVRFANKEQVARALAEMKNPMIHGKRCGVAASEDNDTLFLGNICNTWTKEAIKKRLLDYGVEGVQSLTLVPDTQNEGQSRGFAFLEFSCHADAMLAFKRLQQPDALFGHPERTAKVAFAEPIKEADAEVMAQVKSVFIDGLPPYWDEERVKNRFKAYGLIERVVLARNMSSAKRNDFGFVNFSTHEEALACIEATNNTELGDDGKAKLKVRVRLSNPLPKSQAVKGEMSGGFRIGHPGSGFNRPGRGFNRGRAAPRREGFHGDRGFSNHTPGRGGRFNSAYSNNSFEASPSDFRARQAPPAFRGGRWEPSSGRHDFFDRGQGRGYPPPRGPAFEPEGDFGRPFGENPYFHEDVRHSTKRPYSHMEPGPAGYFEPGPPRVRPRFDHYDQPPFSGGNRFDHYDQPPFPGGDRHRDSFGTRGPYSRDYYGHGPGPAPAPAPPPAQYGRGSFRPHHRGGHSGGGHYH